MLRAIDFHPNVPKLQESSDWANEVCTGYKGILDDICNQIASQFQHYHGV